MDPTRRPKSSRPIDAIVIGAGAAGLMCAARAAQRGLRIVLLDHAHTLAEKIRISGGGRCNFTNLNTQAHHYLGENPAFCRSALARFKPTDFLELLRSHGVSWHEKHRGQLFCDGRSQAIIDVLLRECELAHVERQQPCRVSRVEHGEAGFVVHTTREALNCTQLVVATGGLSVPKIGASDLGYRLARQWGHAVVTPRPGLVPLNFDARAWQPYSALSGVSVRAEVGLETAARASAGKAPARVTFDEDLLFTHRGLSGPAILQISSYWREGQALCIDLVPGVDLEQALLQAKDDARGVVNVLTQWLPARLAQCWLEQFDSVRSSVSTRSLADWKDQDVRALARSLQRWTLTPVGTQGWAKAEVTVGGVDTAQLDSKTMQSKLIPGLHFIGEVVDVTGWLGGYNFQWAWASAVACAQALRQT